MSTTKNISLWKEKAEIDYIPIFMSLWLSLNAWARDRFGGRRDRDIINLCKSGGHHLSNKFSELMHEQGATGNRFRGNLAELHRALENSDICYPKSTWRQESQKEKVSFNNIIVEWGRSPQEFETIIKTKGQKSKILIDEELWVDDDNKRLFAAYIEILYQVRCELFHGNLSPTQENERVIKQLYITLSMIMVNV